MGQPRPPWLGCFAPLPRYPFPLALSAALTSGQMQAAPITKESHIPVDRPRHPWLGRFALRSGLYLPFGLGAAFSQHIALLQVQRNQIKDRLS